MAHCKSSSTTGTTSLPSNVPEGGSIQEASGEQRQFRRSVGKLLWRSPIRPDIQIAVKELTRGLQLPMHSHQHRLKQLLRYLQGTTEFKFVLRPNSEYTSSVVLRAFSDADWASSATDGRKSTSGGMIQVLGANVDSYSRTQASVALSSAESEFYAIASAANELLHVKHFVEEAQLFQVRELQILTDSSSAKSIASRQGVTKRTRHLDVRFLFLQDLVQKGDLRLVKVPGENNSADLFTKYVSKDILQKHSRDAGLQFEEMQQVHAILRVHSKDASPVGNELPEALPDPFRPYGLVQTSIKNLQLSSVCNSCEFSCFKCTIQETKVRDIPHGHQVLCLDSSVRIALPRVPTVPFRTMEHSQTNEAQEIPEDSDLFSSRMSFDVETSQRLQEDGFVLHKIPASTGFDQWLYERIQQDPILQFTPDNFYQFSGLISEWYFAGAHSVFTKGDLEDSRWMVLPGSIFNKLVNTNRLQIRGEYMIENFFEQPFSAVRMGMYLSKRNFHDKKPLYDSEKAFLVAFKDLEIDDENIRVRKSQFCEDHSLCIYRENKEDIPVKFKKIAFFKSWYRFFSTSRRYGMKKQCFWYLSQCITPFHLPCSTAILQGVAASFGKDFYDFMKVYHYGVSHQVEWCKHNEKSEEDFTYVFSGIKNSEYQKKNSETNEGSRGFGRCRAFQRALFEEERVVLHGFRDRSSCSPHDFEEG